MLSGNAVLYQWPTQSEAALYLILMLTQLWAITWTTTLSAFWRGSVLEGRSLEPHARYLGLGWRVSIAERDSALVGIQSLSLSNPNR